MHTETRLGENAEAGAIAGLASISVLSMVLDRTTDGVMLVDAAGAIVYVNQPLLQMFGYDSTDLLGQPLDVLVPECHREQHHHHLNRFVHSPEPRPMGRADLDIEGRHADGSCFSIDVQLNALPETSLVVATVRDMTAQRQLAADAAIVRIDLANAKTHIGHLDQSLDLVIQRLFALGASLAAGASNPPLLTERLASAVNGIDEIIDTVQQHRQSCSP